MTCNRGSPPPPIGGHGAHGDDRALDASRSSAAPPLPCDVASRVAPVADRDGQVGQIGHAGQTGQAGHEGGKGDGQGRNVPPRM